MIRPARLHDIKAVHRLIADRAEKGHILPRAMTELYSQVRAFKVWVENSSEEIAGCGALEIVWEDLAEIRSLAVKTDHEGRGIGSALVEALLEDAREMGVKRVFLLTYRPRFFQRLGFDHLEKSQLPHKIWADCIRCTKFPECDELALVRVP